MPEMEAMLEDVKQISDKSDEYLELIKRRELASAIKKQSEVMNYLVGLLHGE